VVRIPRVRGPSTVAKAYRLLKTILSTAVADELLVRNPCVPRGAASERTPERRPPTLAEVDALATAIAPRWRMLVVFAAWSGLRWGELVGLTRQRVDLLHGCRRTTSRVGAGTTSRVGLRRGDHGMAAPSGLGSGWVASAVSESGLSSWWVMSSSQQGVCPPVPRRRQNSWQSGQRWSSR